MRSWFSALASAPRQRPIVCNGLLCTRPDMKLWLSIGSVSQMVVASARALPALGRRRVPAFERGMPPIAPRQETERAGIAVE
jgi:hypothetical protein